MIELRWNPLLREWIAVATHRQERPQMPKDWCPFCPDSGRVPDRYDVHIYPNDFPTFVTPSPVPEIRPTGLYRTTEAVGVSDVVLYHPDHTKTLADLPVSHIEKIVAAWQKRFKELSARDEIQYVFIFENKGDVIGVTMPHPHGQIYAFPFIPPKIQVKIDSAREHHGQTRRCLFCDILKSEKESQSRIIWETDHFVVFVPFFARYPYEVHIYPKRHVQYITQLTDVERSDFASILRVILRKYDNLFGFSFPYMKMLFQAPTDGKPYDYWHFHVEFNPPYRSATKLKYLASCESGTGTFINDTAAEEKAEELRRVAHE